MMAGPPSIALPVALGVAILAPIAGALASGLLLLGRDAACSAGKGMEGSQAG